jgi:hypothetical protein
MSKPACLTWTVDGSGLDDWHRDECAMCGGSATIAGRMVMDHDHATGLNRGWLCRSCNSVEPHAETPWWVAWRAGQNPAGMLGVEEPYVHLWRIVRAIKIVDTLVESGRFVVDVSALPANLR